MKLTGLSLIGLCFLMLTACADRSGYQNSDTGAPIADATGSCIQRVIDDHNKILDEAENYDKTQNNKYLVELKKACYTFKAEMGKSSCYSVNTATSKVEKTAYDFNISNVCDNTGPQ